MGSPQQPTRFTFASSAVVAPAADLPPLESYLVRVRGRQWQITDTHLETVPDGAEYFIEFSRLLETTDRVAGTFYKWAIHLAPKSWVDLDDFMSMFTHALDSVAAPRVDADILARTLGETARYHHDLNDPVYQADLAAWEETTSNGSRYHIYSVSEVLGRPYVQPPGSVLPLTPTELRARTRAPGTPGHDQ